MIELNNIFNKSSYNKKNILSDNKTKIMKMILRSVIAVKIAILIIIMILSRVIIMTVLIK